MTAENVSRRSFVRTGATAVVGGVIGLAAGYYVGTLSVPPSAPGVATTVTAPGAMTTVTATGAGVLGRKLKLAVVTPSRANDQSWGQQGVEGLRTVAQRFGADFSFSEGLGYGEEPIRATEDYIRGGYDLVVEHGGGYREFSKNIVNKGEAKDTKILIHGYGEVPEDAIPGKLATYLWEGNQEAYPAGYLAGLLTKTNTAGIVQSMETDANWLRMSGCFAQGFKAANPKSKLLFSIVGSYEDPAKAKEFTLAQIGVGADVIFGMGDGTSFGIMDACGDKGAWFIDVIGDKRSIDTKGVLLTSVIWDFSGAYQDAVIDVYNGKYGTRFFHITPANGGAYLLPINPKVPANIVAQASAVSDKVAKGEIQIKLVDTPEQLHALFKELGYE
jgi:simple sugar transport system substrate-binding protein